jgi:two-component system cell cycle response regulator
MPKILTVDDSRAVRMLVAKNARELGVEVEEAEDGQQGLAKALEGAYDLLVLDVTMPVLDGPAMLAELRAKGNKTPVLMLTSESKRSIVATVMKLGIDDYILKPFQPDELKAKIAKALKMAVPAPGEKPAIKDAASGVQAAPVADPKGAASGKQAVDILCIDDMENVSKRLRTLVPEQVTLANATNAQTALAICRDRSFKVVLLDNDMPGVDSRSLMRQIRVMQPQAAFLMLSLRSVQKAQDEAREGGFAGVVFKPFDQAALEEILARYFDNQEVIEISENVITVPPFKGRETRLAAWFAQVSTAIFKNVEDIAAACFGEIIIDISQSPILPEKTARLALLLAERSRKVGLELRLVGSTEFAGSLKQLVETADLRVFASVAEAQATGGA